MSGMRTIDDIKVIIYNRSDAGADMVRRFRGMNGKEMVEVPDDRGLTGAVNSLRARGLRSKEVVILKKFMGRMFQRCPGSAGVVCCNYMLINTGFNCLYDCAYCFLNSYLNSFGIVQFINPEISFAELAGTAAEDEIIRIGTGEFTDSLMLDEVSGIGASCVAGASNYPNVFLELKTKSDNIRHLLDIKDKGNAVLAWTLNTDRNITRFEADTASLNRRIAAAIAAAGAGYLIAFHFDPIILYDGCLPEYRAVIDRVFASIDPGRIAWISLGCFRYGAGFRDAVRNSPGRALTAAELFPGGDGKYRYLKRARIGAYRGILERIRDYGDEVFVYLCMETEDVWREVFGTSYRSSRDLERAFSGHLKKNYL